MSQDAPPSSTPSSRRGCFTRLLLIACLSFVLVVVLCVVGLLVGEGKGRKAWGAFKAEWESKGESFDWRATIPAELGGGANFVRHPLFDDVEAVEAAMDLASMPNASAQTQLVADWSQGTSLAFLGLFDEEAEGAPSTEDEARAAFETFLESKQRWMVPLAEAARRSHCRFDIDYEKGGVFAGDTAPFMMLCRRGSMLFLGSGLVALERGESQKAMEDWETMTYLARHVDRGPGIIHGLVSLVCQQQALQLLWEGLKDQRWEVYQLERMERILAVFDYHESALRHFREERSGYLFVIEEHLINRGALPAVLQRPGSGFDGMGHIPKAWLYRNLISYCELLQEYLLAPDGVLVERLQLDKMAGFESDLAGRQFLFGGIPHPHHLFVCMSMPALEGTAGIHLRAQSSVDLARLAIANELHRLEHGSFSDSLESLELDPKPLDPISGAAYHYEGGGEESPVIYGIGVNGRDDGGRAEMDWRDGDWVWQYTPNRTGSE